MNKKNEFSIMSIGLITLVTIFIVLTMAIFSALSLTTSLNHSSRSSQYSQHVSEYYAANNKAEEVIAKIEDILNESEATTFINALENEGITLTNSSYSFIEEINDSQSLAVTVEITYPSYKITQWQTIYTSEWDPDNSLTLLPINN